VEDAPPPGPDDRAPADPPATSDAPDAPDDLGRSARLIGIWLVAAVLLVAGVILVVQLAVGDDDDAPATAPTAATVSSAVPEATATTAAPPPTTAPTTAPPTTAAATTTTVDPGPVRVGFVNQEALVGSYPDVRAAAEKAVAYVNQDLGGVAGRPVQLVVCTTDSTPARSQACAAELARQGVVAVTLGVDFGSSGIYDTLAAAGIPVVGGVPRVLDDYQSDDAHFFVGGSVVTLPALAEYATQVLQAKRVAVVYRDVATFESVARTLVVAPLQAAGARTDVVTVANTSAPKPRIPAGTDAVIALADADGCAGLAQAVRAVVPGVPILLPTSCGSVAAVTGLGVEGPLYVPSELADPTGPAPAFDPALARDLDRYRAAMGTDAPTTGFAPVAFAAIVNVRQLAADAAAPTAAAIRDVLAGATDRPGFLGHAYDCAQVHVAVAPALCQSSALVYGVGTGAAPTPAAWTDGATRLS
jgi:branched-chain amino acid transport system substrate-binding protein